MKKREFMNRLAQLLSDVPYDERIEALQYYEDYFADAGIDKEQDIIAELQSPEQLAKMIKTEIAAGMDAGMPETGRNFQYPKASPEKSDNADERNDEQYSGNMNYGFYQEGYTEPNQNAYQEPYNQAGSSEYYGHQKKNMTGGRLAMLILGAIFLGPFIIGIGAAIFGILVSVFAVIGSLLAVFCLVGGAFIIGGIILTVFGIINIFVSMPRGILIAGAGLVLFGTGFIFIAVFLLLLRMTKWMFSRTISLLNNLFNKRRVYA